MEQTINQNIGGNLMTGYTVFGIEAKVVITILALLVVFLFVLVFLLLSKMNLMSRKYSALMSGKTGADLEKIIRYRFKEMDQVKANAKRVTKEHKEIKRKFGKSISKVSLVKYDAFEKMAGKLSFVMVLLDDDNSGIVFNSMHTKEGCFTYAKEIIKGESYIPLSDEEFEAVEKAKTVEEEIEDLTSEANAGDELSFDMKEDL